MLRVTTITFLPISLLCKLKAVLALYPFSRMLIKRLVSFSPNRMLSPHPPHCQSPFPLRCFFTAQPHPGILPCRHWSVISWIIAAVLIAWMKAVSRVAARKCRGKEMRGYLFHDKLTVSNKYLCRSSKRCLHAQVRKKWVYVFQMWSKNFCWVSVPISSLILGTSITLKLLGIELLTFPRLLLTNSRRQGWYYVRNVSRHQHEIKRTHRNSEHLFRLSYAVLCSFSFSLLLCLPPK